MSKIFGIGLSRTGTTKLAAILRELGYETSDFVGELMGFDSKGRPIDRDWYVLDRHDAFTDSPIPLIYPELDERCPGSKFILTTRSLDSWLESMDWMLSHGRIIWSYGPRVDAYHRALYGTRRFNRRRLVEAWNRHHSSVTEYFRDRNDLFIIDIEEGFDMAAICDFLGIPRQQVNAQSVTNGRRNATVKQRVRYWARIATRWV